MEKGIRYAYFLGWARALRHIPLILLKLLVNLATAYAMIAPLRQMLHRELDNSTMGEALSQQMDASFFSEFLMRNEGAFDAMTLYRWPLIVLLLIVNLYLSGGILETIQRSDRAVWREIFHACRSHFMPLVLTMLLSLAFAVPVVLLPLIGLDKGLLLVENLPDPRPLAWSFWIAVLVGILLLIYAITQISARFESNRAGRASFVIVVLALSSFGLYKVFGFIKDIDRNHPDQLLSFTVYWFGVALILGLGGTWVIRVYHYTRLLVCRPYRNPEVARLPDTVGQFFKAIGFTLRFYARTFWIWALFTLTHLLLFFAQDALYSAIEINAWSTGVEFGLGQLFIGLRIAVGIAMAGAFIFFLWGQEGLPQMPEEAAHLEPDEDGDLPWRSGNEPAAAQVSSHETAPPEWDSDGVQRSGEEAVDARPQATEGAADSIKWEPMGPEDSEPATPKDDGSLDPNRVG